MFHYFGSLPEGDELVKKLSKLDWDEVSLGALFHAEEDADWASGSTEMASIFALMCSMTTLCRSR